MKEQKELENQMNTRKPTPEEVREWLSYDPESGEIRRIKVGRKSNRRTAVGRATGSVRRGHKTSYINVNLLGRSILAHHIAFVCMTGQYPAGEVDHINGNGTDNRWANLRIVSRRANAQNQPRRSDNRSGTTGVYRRSDGKRWVAEIMLDGRHKYLGSFIDMADAVAARKQAEAEAGFHINHGRA